MLRVWGSSCISRAASRKGLRVSTTESLKTRVANGGSLISLPLKMSNDDAPDDRVRDFFPAGGWHISTGMITSSKSLVCRCHTSALSYKKCAFKCQERKQWPHESETSGRWHDHTSYPCYDRGLLCAQHVLRIIKT